MFIGALVAFVERLADLGVQLRGLDQAVDEAGNRLAQVIAEHRDEWLAQRRRVR